MTSNKPVCSTLLLFQLDYRLSGTEFGNVAMRVSGYKNQQGLSGTAKGSVFGLSTPDF